MAQFESSGAFGSGPNGRAPIVGAPVGQAPVIRLDWPPISGQLASGRAARTPTRAQVGRARPGGPAAAGRTCVISAGAAFIGPIGAARVGPPAAHFPHGRALVCSRPPEAAPGAGCHGAQVGAPTPLGGAINLNRAPARVHLFVSLVLPAVGALSRPLVGRNWRPAGAPGAREASQGLARADRPGRLVRQARRLVRQARWRTMETNRRMIDRAIACAPAGPAPSWQVNR